MEIEWEHSHSQLSSLLCFALFIALEECEYMIASFFTMISHRNYMLACKHIQAHLLWHFRYKYIIIRILLGVHWSWKVKRKGLASTSNMMNWKEHEKLGYSFSFFFSKASIALHAPLILLWNLGIGLGKLGFYVSKEFLLTQIFWW